MMKEGGKPRIVAVLGITVSALTMVSTVAGAQGVLFVKNNNVGIRVSDPDIPLQVLLSGSKFNQNAATVASFQNNASTTDGVLLTLIAGSNASAQFVFGDSDDEDAGRFVYSNAIHAMRFFTNGAEQARLEGDGDLCLGSTSCNHDLEIADGAACSEIDASETAFTNCSSRTLKEKISKVEVPDILAKIGGIGVYEYNFIGGPEDRIGLMAEDFHTIFSRGSDKMLSGHEVQLAMWLAIQQLSTRNRELTQRLSNLEELLAAKDSSE